MNILYEFIEKNVSELIALIAAFTSLLAVHRTKKQAEIAQNHNILSVKPHLRFDVRLRSDSQQVGVFLGNKGIGPAFIKGLFVSYDGEEKEIISREDWYEIFKFYDVKFLAPFFVFGVGDSIQVGEEVWIVGIKKEDYKKENYENDFRSLIGNLKFRVKYESLYEEHNEANWDKV